MCRGGLDQRAARAGSGAAKSELADRRRRPAADVVAAQRDAASARPRVKNMKLVWTLQLDNQPRAAAQPLPAADRLRRADGERAARDRASSPASPTTSTASTSRQGTQIWKRHFDSTFEEPAGGRGPYPLCPGGLTATPVIVPTERPGKYTVYAISWDGRLRQLDVATGRGPRARRAVPAAERQAVRPEPVQQRALHDDRAGLRRQSESVLRLRPGDEEGRQLQPGQRRPVAAARPVDRQGRHASTPAAATATTSPSSRSSARRSSR